MNDLIGITRGFFVSSELDSEGHLEIVVDDYSAGIWLDRDEIFALVLHLGKVIEDADEKQETET